MAQELTRLTDDALVEETKRAAYCTRALLMSEQAAYKRITAARAARRHPVILELLAGGELTLSSVKILAPHLTDENVDALLEAARHKSTRDVEQLIAAVHPQPDVPATVRALPAPVAVSARPTRRAASW